MREIDKIIMAAREANASDIHITKGLYLLYRVKGTLVHAPMQPTPEETEEMLYGLLDEGQKKRLTKDMILTLPSRRRTATVRG